MAIELIAKSYRDDMICVSSQVLKEFANFAFKRTRKSAAEINATLLKIGAYSFVADTKELITDGVIGKEQWQVGFYDALMIAAANKAGCSTMYTEDLNNVHAVTVLGSYAPESTVSTPKVQLGDETHLSPTLDLSGWAGTFNKAFGGGLTFAEGATISVKVGDRRVPKKVIGWTEGTGPVNVNFVLTDAVGRLSVESDGVYRHTGLQIIVK